jgi:hypothetical protein
MKKRKFKVIVTKNNEQFRIVRTYNDKQCAIDKFEKVFLENQKIKFEKKYVRYKPVIFHLQLLSYRKFVNGVDYEKDDMGRNIPVLPVGDMFVWKKLSWKEPENFSIYGSRKRYTYDTFIKMIGNTSGIIGMSVIQNHVVFDVSGKPIIVILKNIDDAVRLYGIIRDERFKHILTLGNLTKMNRKNIFLKFKKFNIPLRMFYTNTTRQ